MVYEVPQPQHIHNNSTHMNNHGILAFMGSFLPESKYGIVYVFVSDLLAIEESIVN